jgi:tetratricopeptide (TPR) repeat protein
MVTDQLKNFNIILLFLLPAQAYAQTAFLDDPVVTRHIRNGINHIYNLEFDKSDVYLDSLLMRYPNHPSIPFYRGMQVYWANYPVPQGGEISDQFVEYIETSVDLAKELLEKDKMDIEGIFFDLAARSFLVMYYADNGHPAKCFPHLDNVYRQLMKAFELEDQFNEFYFFTGLYNYYIEAYTEAHPIYKPVTLLFKNGDKESGLRSLDYAFRNSNFMRVEASHFLVIIYLGFEHNYQTALSYAKELHSMFPNNAYFLARYIEMLLVNRDFEQARTLSDSLMTMGPFYKMKALIFLGLYAEGKEKNPEKAKRYFLQGINEAEPFGYYAGYTVAYAYMGMSRYYENWGNDRKAREYYKLTKATNAYPHVYEINKNP